MPYFEKIDSFNTYEGHDSDFHYDYNANSGGGQAFLGGSYIDEAGVAFPTKNLEGVTAAFKIRFHDIDGMVRDIDLDADETACFSITSRGTGNQNMKFSTEGKKRPSLLIPALFMMPGTCVRNMAGSLDVSPLTIDNYWLRSMWLDLELGSDEVVWFVPKDYVFEGGCSKKRELSADGKVVGTPVYFRLNFEQRLNDILLVAGSASNLPVKTTSALKYFSALYLGAEQFNYSVCDTHVKEMMVELAQTYPEQYSGISDPLPLLMRISGLGERDKGAARVSKEISYPRNYIFFGAPGTGKSHQLDKLAEKSFPKANMRRVTFYPDYTYSQFVGCFKPFTEDDGEIGYRYIPGPFLETYVEASLHPYENYLLIIEELNRANPAAVFGDVFQLLDRDTSGASKYYVSVPMEMARFIRGALSEIKGPEKSDIENYFDPDMDFDEFAESMSKYLALPPNMYTQHVHLGNDEQRRSGRVPNGYRFQAPLGLQIHGHRRRCGCCVGRVWRAEAL